MDTLRVGALFSHLLSCGSPLWSWGVSIHLFPLYDVLRGGYEVVWGTWCLSCAFWGAPLIYEGVCHSWRGSKFFLGPNGALDPDFHLWLGLRLSFKVIVLVLHRAFTQFTEKCDPCLTVPWQWRPWWVSLSRYPLLSDGLTCCCRFPSNYSEGERLTHK